MERGGALLCRLHRQYGRPELDGYIGTHYSDYSGRNDIIGAQLARDGEYLYFHVECASDITPYTDPLWMNLYIDCNGQNAGWNTFDYVVNKSAASADTVVLERFTGDGYASEKVADCAYTVDGRYMTVRAQVRHRVVRLRFHGEFCLDG